MKQKLVIVYLLFIAMLAGVLACYSHDSVKSVTQDKASSNVVALNEVEQLFLSGDTQTAVEKTDELKSSMRKETTEYKTSGSLYAAFVICAVIVGAAFLYIYFAILRSFEKLESFAEDIAAGNFEKPLLYERTNYFGKFTWAFDSMRREITKARSCEREAIENNKTVIATLFHDIKTPIASIRAYAEGLEANMDTTPEKRQKYISVIMRKCDEVSRLTNDLFLHSISDLDRLKTDMQPLELCAFTGEAVEEIAAEHNDVLFIKPDFTADVKADRTRLLQICENLINNSRKYAKTNIEVSITKEQQSVTLHFRDYGSGINDSDMPFIFDKFYRGKNCGSEQGSGLGLYIVKYLAEKQGGTVLLHNLPDGFEAQVMLPLL